MTALKRRSAEWNAIEAELNALWEKHGRPRGVAWTKIATPLWTRQREVEDALVPLLFKWAADNGCVGRTHVWLAGFYAKIRKETGLAMNWQGIQRLTDLGHEAATLASLDELARTMPEKKWGRFMKSFCTLSQEGKNTKDYLLEARRELRKTA